MSQGGCNTEKEPSFSHKDGCIQDIEHFEHYLNPGIYGKLLKHMILNVSKGFNRLHLSQAHLEIAWIMQNCFQNVKWKSLKKDEDIISLAIVFWLLIIYFAK